MKGKKVSMCIVCGKPKKGIAVHEDHVIFAIRWFKTNITKNVSNNALVVCKECYPKYAKERRRYTSRLSLYIGIGLIFAILLIISTPSVGSVLAAIGVLVFLYALSLLSYIPRLELEIQHGIDTGASVSTKPQKWGKLQNNK